MKRKRVINNDIIVDAENGATVWDTAKIAYEMFSLITIGYIRIRHNDTLYNVELTVKPIATMEQRGIKSE
jgi:hypothetical protein